MSAQSLSADLFWSFRSPYSYLATSRYRQIDRDYNVIITLRPVLPIAIRNPGFFKTANPMWLPYLFRDCLRLGEYLGLPLAIPNPDPVVQNIETREIAAEQPYIHRLTRLGIEACRRGRGLPFADEVSRMIWGGTANWDRGDHLKDAAARAGLDLADMEAAVAGHEADLDAETAANQQALEAAGHWGVPTLVFNGEPFFGQDRIDVALWRMQQAGLEKVV